MKKRLKDMCCCKATLYIVLTLVWTFLLVGTINLIGA